MVVLDEAQAIKNPASQGDAARLPGCKARHRLCLTGTPIENHLGELWSLFDFLMPGPARRPRAASAACSARRSRSRATRRGSDLLAPRASGRSCCAAPRSEVAAELPPKTEILRRIELAGDQRDLYETVRLAMHERVRQEIAAKGFARSQIAILDALLKLRQVCCDPRLVKLAAAQPGRRQRQARAADGDAARADRGRPADAGVLAVHQHARPDRAGARARADRLRRADRRHRDRATPVARFQAGEVPLFLISLKAGGTGLNLTAADTVIHYDPWWNPAVEAQATDRAHRIGQDKPVFVYKLIAAGTVEERMLELQERKKALAAGICRGRRQARRLRAADLQALFQPLG